MKYPLGIQSFRQIREDGYVYIDKTDIVYSLVHEGKTYFLSRPRRFGKSLLVSTLEAYFLGNKELFKGLKIYSMEALKYSDIADYWFQTGTPEYLSRLLISSNENLDEVAGKYYPSSQFIDNEANKEMPLPMIYQSGYLTIKGYRPRTDTFLLDFPNDEVKRGFTALLASNYLKSKEDTKSFIACSADELYDGNIDSFISGMKSFFASIPYSLHLKKDKERFFHYTFYLLLRLASTYVTYTEKQQSQGRVDCVIETDRFIYIFEFKLDGTAENALQQIEVKGYAEEYATDERKLFKIGINFSSKTGTISDWKVAE